MGGSQTSAQEHTSVSSYLLPDGRESTIQNFDAKDANFRISRFQGGSSLISRETCRVHYNPRINSYGFRSAHHVSGSCPTGQLLSCGRESFPLAIGGQRPNSPVGAGVWGSAARPLGQDRKT